MKKIMTMTEILATRTLYKKKLMKSVMQDEDSSAETGGLFSNSVKAMIDKSKFTEYISFKPVNKDVCINGKPVEYMTEAIKAKYKSVTDTLDNYIKLNRVINCVNSMVVYNYNGNDISLAELRTTKSDVVMETRRSIIESLRNDLQKATKYYVDKMTAIKNGEEKHVESTFGANAASVVNAEEIAKVLKYYHESNDIEYVDPLKLEALVNKLSEEFDDFYTTMDFRLSEINAMINVEVDLDEETNFFKIVSVGNGCKIVGGMEI